MNKSAQDERPGFPVERIVGPALKPWRTQKEWLTLELLHSAPGAEWWPLHGNGGAQLQHPLGGPLTWVRCPLPDAIGVTRVADKWHWLLPPNEELRGRT